MTLFNIRNFNSEKDFRTFFNAKELSDRCGKFKWLTINSEDHPEKLPQFAIDGELHYTEEPPLHSLQDTCKSNKTKRRN